MDAAFRLPKIIAALHREEPLINIEVIVTNEPSDLLRREADIALRNFHSTQHNLIAKKLENEVIRLYGTAAYLEKLQNSSDATDLNVVQIIGFDHSSTVTDMLIDKGWKLNHNNFQLLTTFQLLQLELCKENPELAYAAIGRLLPANEQPESPLPSFAHSKRTSALEKYLAITMNLLLLASKR